MKPGAAACTDVGRRREANEDSFALAPELDFYLVADGMGGHKAGKVASQLASDCAVRAIEALRSAQVSPAEKLRHAVTCANREILTAAQDDAELRGMGTTLVAILAENDRIALAHVGDSRAYRVRRGRIRLLTDDHSIVAELVRRRKISEHDARGHPHRHVLTKALGVAPALQPDLAELTPLPGDTFVLCSDGLTTHLSDAEILDIVDQERELQKVCDALVASANRCGGLDNITTLVLRFDAEAGVEAGAGHSPA
jgi:protein phosphatase